MREVSSRARCGYAFLLNRQGAGPKSVARLGSDRIASFPAFRSAF